MIQAVINNNIVLSSTIDSLSKIESFIDDVCERYKFGMDNYGNILIALTEAVNNAITHGNKFDPTKNVDLHVETSDCGVLFIVKDEGDGFDFNNVPDPTLPQNIEKVDGRGVFLMKALSDTVDFENNGSVVKLNFFISTN